MISLLFMDKPDADINEKMETYDRLTHNYSILIKTNLVVIFAN